MQVRPVKLQRAKELFDQPNRMGCPETYLSVKRIPFLAGGVAPLAAHENMASQEGQSKKKSFVPSWSKKAKAQSSQDAPSKLF